MIGELYDSYYNELLAWASVMTQNAALAEDLVQEAFLKAMNHEETLLSLNPYQQRSWLYKSVRNMYVDDIRHRSRETAVETLPEHHEEASGYEELDQEQLLQCLPEEERMLFVMRYMEGYNSTELGKMFGLSPAGIRTKLAQARKHLRKELEGSL